MDKSLLERLIRISTNLRILEGDLIKINAKYPYEPALVYKLGVELDCLDAILEQLQAETSNEETNHHNP